MKIKSGTPITVNPRIAGGVTISQGTSWVRLSPEEWHWLAESVATILAEQEKRNMHEHSR